MPITAAAAAQQQHELQICMVCMYVCVCVCGGAGGCTRINGALKMEKIQYCYAQHKASTTTRQQHRSANITTVIEML